MREVGRAQLGHYPTPSEVTDLIASLFKPHESDKPFNLVDAGCGNGEQVERFRQCLSDHAINVHGIELDRGRAREANERFQHHNGKCIWGAIEETQVMNADMLWFNPPYDKIRGGNRLELELLSHCCSYVAKGTGIIICIVPDYVFYNEATGFAQLFEQYFKRLGVWNFPAEHYPKFKQCVLIGQRLKRGRQRANDFPVWAASRNWEELTDSATIIEPMQCNRGFVMKLAKLGKDHIREALKTSTMHNVFLEQACANTYEIEHPPLPLKDGHLALALAGGLCNGVIQNDDEQFILKGMTDSQIRKVKTEEKENRDGEVTAIVDTHRTVYEMRVRCLRETGVIEEYSSVDEQEQPSHDKD